jgi:two-component system, chemotaxis family, CheB/CheR fusion protein
MAKRSKAAPERPSTASPSRPSRGERTRPGRGSEESLQSPSRIVGIGASAGGLDAIRELLQALPADTGLAFVIVQHLAPDQKSMLPDILSRSTRMPVVEIVDARPLLANHVYVIAPDTAVEYARGALMVRKRESGKRHLPVDRLFATLADGLGERAVGVILSGTDRDGSIGAQRIKAVGGVTFAQDHSAQFDGMPRAAIEKGVVDFVLSPKEIARKVIDVTGRRTAPLATPSSVPEFERIIQLLNAPDRIDFLHYKTPTIERRIQRRMLLRNVDDLAAYRRMLEQEPAERDALHRDVLIGVTRFFRDPSRSAALKKTVFPMLFAKRSEEPLRFWVPGCSTGEEAYSLAIVLAEYLAEQKLTRKVQIFGSDINEESVAFARAGIYPKSVEEAVSATRLKKFFTPSAAGYSVGRSIRELCVFAEHNLLKDPPFSRLDLISCSNLLIYLQPPQQERVAAVFRYALNGDGLLMLGPSESIRANVEGFVLIDKKYKLYGVAPGSRPRLDLSFGATGRSEAARETAPAIHAPATEDLTRVVDRLLLERYAHPALVVNEAGEAVEFRGDLQPYLMPASGAPSFKLSKLLHRDLLLEVRTAMFKARHKNAPVRREAIEFKAGAEVRHVGIEVIPGARSAHDRIYVITFEPATPAVEADHAARRHAEAHSETDRLQKELTAARDYLTQLTSEHEQSDSALQATGEALQTANEELQSTIEELETAKEELQSTNEELSTLNDELRIRNADLVTLGDDLMNLLSSIDTPVIMVDRQLVIRLFNPTAQRLFSFRDTDVGRPIDAFKPLMELPDLPVMLNRVIDTPTVVATDVQSREGRWYSLRVRPYHSSRNQIEGAVITLIDTHDLRMALTAAEQARDSAERARSVADDARAEALNANRLKDEFLSTLSHELRTPMTSILGWAQMMRTTQLDEETMATAVATIERGTYAQIRLIDDLLDISRITTGRLRLDQRVFNLRTLIEETLDVLRPAVSAKEIQVETNLDQAAVTMYGDPERIRQVIWNLLSNAVKFTPRGGTISLSVIRSNSEALIRVTDSGEGISPDFLPRIFDRFSQGHTGSKRHLPGLGLGLAIAKYLVDLHGGTIVAESAGAGRGATFTITLPLVAAAGSAEGAAGRSSATGVALPSLTGMTLLVVEDDADSLKLVVAALEQCGAEVVQATSVGSAMERLKESSPAVIISDIAMPFADGFDLLRRVRALEGPLRNVPMVALTAFTSDDDRRRILGAGFDEYLAKPVAPLHLAHLVAALPKRRSSGAH